MKWRKVKKELKKCFLKKNKFDTERYSKVQSFISFVRIDKKPIGKITDFETLFDKYYLIFEIS